MGGEKDGKKWGDFNELVYGDKSIRVRGETYFHSEGSVALTVGHGEAEAGGTLYLQVEKHKVETIGGDNHIHADGEQRIHVTGDASFEAEGKRQEKAGTSYALDAGQEIHLKGGSKVIIEAAAQVSLKVGGNFVDISPAGVAIQGAMVLINSGGAPGSGKGSQPQKPGIAKLAPRRDPTPADDARPGLKSCPS